MRRALAFLIAIGFALSPSPVRGASAWGSPGYGDPPGWCTNLSDMWVTSVVTNDPLVGDNPERDTFYGFHANPGYDDWFGYFYGDFRGIPGDASGWVRLLHENFPHHYHWNFVDSGWAVHGHVKQYIAYYNWTFGGQCGIGRRGASSPPPYMADQYGYPVVDIYVDAVPPFTPQPRVWAITPTSITFAWDPVADRGDGAGADFFVSGLDHYVSWVTLTDRPGPNQLAVTADPRPITVAGVGPSETACVHVQAVDRAGNSSPVAETCAAPLVPPPMPDWRLEADVAANPAGVGLVGLESWFWLAPRPRAMSVQVSAHGVQYLVTATPTGVGWDYGDGASASYAVPEGFGTAYPVASRVAHVYAAHDQAGYEVRARVTYRVTWSEVTGNQVLGPYPLGSVTLPATPLSYPVEQAQPELLGT